MTQLTVITISFLLQAKSDIGYITQQDMSYNYTGNYAYINKLFPCLHEWVLKPNISNNTMHKTKPPRASPSGIWMVSSNLQELAGLKFVFTLKRLRIKQWRLLDPLTTDQQDFC